MISIQFFKEACDSILKDEEFCACPKKSKTLKEILERLLSQLCAVEKGTVNFSNWLYSSLKRIIDGAQSERTKKIKREKLWVSFHQIRSAQDFKEKWEEFLTSQKLNADPALYQYLSSIYLKLLIDSILPIIKDVGTIPSDLSYEEINAIRYIGGYIIQSISKDQSVSASTKYLIKDEASPMSSSNEWVCCVDRGGLIHITDGFCQTLSAIEYCIRCHSTTNEFDKKEIHDSILGDSDVLFNWCSATGMIDEDKKGVILSLIVAKYVTIRGFSFTKSVMETYKQVSKKNTSKSKPLRKSI